MIRITIDTENAAFHDYDNPDADEYMKWSEVARILRKLAKQLEPDIDGNTPPIRLMDFNGNCVGKCEEVD